MGSLAEDSERAFYHGLDGASPPSCFDYALSGLAALGTLQVPSNAGLPTFVSSWLQKWSWSLRCHVFTHLVRMEQNAFWGLSQRTLKERFTLVRMGLHRHPFDITPLQGCPAQGLQVSVRPLATPERAIKHRVTNLCTFNSSWPPN
ncbi:MULTISPECIES: hypothetical protein [unclassified Imperialibacter]|uniref:hypothetical protein n=1 Tax=unclassified Imperialibacter TaxID=2629706 RepID=UPI00125F87C3|nr:MULTISPECIES: hypothetical protein [unclassified Imperialibacter]